MSVPQIIIPDPKEGEREQQLRAYFEEREERLYGRFVQVNVEFKHDPEWRARWLSIEAARAKRGVWLPVSWLFYLAQIGFMGGMIYSLMR